MHPGGGLFRQPSLWSDLIKQTCATWRRAAQVVFFLLFTINTFSCASQAGKCHLQQTSLGEITVAQRRFRGVTFATVGFAKCLTTARRNRMLTERPEYPTLSKQLHG